MACHVWNNYQIEEYPSNKFTNQMLSRFVDAMEGYERQQGEKVSR